MATIVLTAVGTALGGPVGAAIGGLIGNIFDHSVLFPAKGRTGPRLDDMKVQTSVYGAQIPKLFGTMRVAGTVIWATDLRETKTKTGGGKGRPSVTSYDYSASFAVALSARAIRSVRRIWADGNLLRGAAGDFKAGLGAFRLYHGDESQAVDPLIAGAEGLDRAPAHRGIAYALFEDLALADFGNRIPSLTFEVEADEGSVMIGGIVAGVSSGAIESGVSDMVDGFAASGADVGDAIAPLTEAMGLAVVADEMGLRIIRPVGPAEMTMAGAGLCRRANGRIVEAKEHAVAAAQTVPGALSVRHHDAARDYQAGVQRMMRPGPERGEGGIELPAGLSSDAARAIAAERLAARWSGRETMTVRRGWSALECMPGMVVSVEGEQGLWLIEEREWEAMVVRLALRRLPSGTAAIPSGASSGQPIRQGDTPHGPTRLMLLDLPQLRPGLAAAPLIMAAASGGEGWRAAALLRVGATGQADTIGRTASRAIMGVLAAPLGAGVSTLIDEVGAIQVTLAAPDMILHGADEAALALGQNLCLIGGELIQFTRARVIGPAQYQLEGLRRGLRGTDWRMSGHDAGTAFLLIEEDRLTDLSVTGSVQEIGSEIRIAASGIGDPVPVEQRLFIDGAAIRPPCPAHLQAKPWEGGWRISWIRRSRDGWTWSSGGDVPLAEQVEAYVVRVMAGEEVIRMAEVGTCEWTYDAAMVVADGARGTAVEIRQLGSLATGRPARVVLPL